MQLPVRKADGLWELMLRPADLEADIAGTITTRVTDLRYYGAEVAAELELAPGIRLRKTCAHHPGWTVGEEICCSLRVQNPILF